MYVLKNSIVHRLRVGELNYSHNRSRNRNRSSPLRRRNNPRIHNRSRHNSTPDQPGLTREIAFGATCVPPVKSVGPAFPEIPGTRSRRGRGVGRPPRRPAWLSGRRNGRGTRNVPGCCSLNKWRGGIRTYRSYPAYKMRVTKANHLFGFTGIPVR
jgi:hypothetical protein